MRRWLLAALITSLVAVFTPAVYADVSDGAPPVGAAGQPAVRVSTEDDGDTAETTVSDFGLITVGQTVEAVATKKCKAGTRSVSAVSHYYDSVTQTQPAFDLTHKLTFDYDCKNVTTVESDISFVTIMDPTMAFIDWLKKGETGVGKPSAVADAQARVANACIFVSADSECVGEQDPGISWKLTATGGATATYYDQVGG